jgi:uncharacterized protein YydD (DUF2326 family)
MENSPNGRSRINFIKEQLALLHLKYASVPNNNENFEKLKKIFFKIKKLKAELIQLEQKHFDSFEST